MAEVVRRFRVCKLRDNWYVFTTSPIMRGKWHYLNEYDTHAEALDAAIMHTAVLRKVREAKKSQ